MKSSKITPETAAMVLEMHKAEGNPGKIARDLGIPVPAVYNILKEAPKPETKTAEKPAEVILPTRHTGFSKPLTVALKKAGAAIKDTHIAKLYTESEDKRQDWQVAAFQIGIALLAKKEALGHGKFSKWLEAAIPNMTRVSYLKGEDKRTFQRYMYLARRYLSALDLRDKLDQRHGLSLVVHESIKLAADVPNLPALAVTNKFFGAGHIRAFIGNRTLRQLMSDLREAEKDAADDEAEGSKTIDADTHEPVAEEETPDETAVPQSGEQLELQLWSSWKKEAIPAIEGVFKAATAAASRISSDLQKGYWLGVAKDLRAKAESAERFAKAAAIAAEKENERKGKAQDKAAETIS